MILLIIGVVLWLPLYVFIVGVKNEGIKIFDKVMDMNNKFGLLKLNLWMTMTSSIFGFIVLFIVSMVSVVIGARIVLIQLNVI